MALETRHVPALPEAIKLAIEGVDHAVSDHDVPPRAYWSEMEHLRDVVRDTLGARDGALIARVSAALHNAYRDERGHLSASGKDGCAECNVEAAKIVGGGGT
jgi:hypothetical protein